MSRLNRAKRRTLENLFGQCLVHCPCGSVLNWRGQMLRTPLSSPLPTGLLLLPDIHTPPDAGLARFFPLPGASGRSEFTVVETDGVAGNGSLTNSLKLWPAPAAQDKPQLRIFGGDSPRRFFRNGRKDLPSLRLVLPD